MPEDVFDIQVQCEELIPEDEGVFLMFLLFEDDEEDEPTIVPVRTK